MTESNRPRWALPLIGAALVLVGVGGWVAYRNFFSGPPVTNPVPVIESPNVREAIAVPKIRWTDITESSGIRFRHTNGAQGQKLLPETMGSGVAVLDFDNDGKPDLLFVNSRNWPGIADKGAAPTCELYRNLGDGKFEDVTHDSGLAIPIYGMGATAGDYDNDGWTDLLITAMGGSRLFRNEPGAAGKRKFVDVTIEAGLPAPMWPNEPYPAFLDRTAAMTFPSSATFFDYDRDGKLDLLIAQYITWAPAIDRSIDAKLTGVGRAYVPPTQFEGSQCLLYRNRDGKRFEDVSDASGIRVTEREGADRNARTRNVGKSLGVIVCDPNDDGWPDVVVANDTVRNFLFQNSPGDATTPRKFNEIGLLSGVAYAEGRARGGMGIDYGEFRPGRCAVIIANFANEPNTFLCVDNPKRMIFSDAALAVGLAGPSRGPLKFGTCFFDFDLDGRLDLITANGHLEPEISQVQQSQTYPQSAQLFWNTGGNPRLYEPVTANDAGADLFKPIVGRGAAFADLDSDGDLDVILTANNGPPLVLRNDLPKGQHSVRLRLIGDGKTSNRSAIGAMVTLEAGGTTQKRTVVAGRGYLSQSELELTFGLGKIDKIDRITVSWPGSPDLKPEVWSNLPVDQLHRLEQGQAKP
ncbi:CRTAC1 family protein [Tuwongella immobilis]|uniref:ASPIC/UnbV domain-containing protein n=1 Tax=Tuwongella immobilis TaxID=692036 RepID=A0A6C2YMI6_9BACT|nr:CRTAC1 family protein [Tuwongella immobilis]VIP02531.1 ASPIC/UnbV domain-containing protein OS=Rhodopirellula maiorica SM1 GN=RMSM_01873 PE=4 SV=1: VCBS: VCBS: UnbV_ASPIC [Tuwongella immobilis]VTS01682.1 ASPIC/UnbV domain-containing protein OS=Rhodopirellula maiorica SM1 GN=RMSM_01873 PE=4 SV=1: VCBS: VCBS: UnbV_ASPIC [Tuwongella immobilis]